MIWGYFNQSNKVIPWLYEVTQIRYHFEWYLTILAAINLILPFKLFQLPKCLNFEDIVCHSVIAWGYFDQSLC